MGKRRMEMRRMGKKRRRERGVDNNLQMHVMKYMYIIYIKTYNF